MLQVENEFGFVGPNEAYMKHLVGTVRAALGNDVIIYTTDPPPNIAKGSIAGDSVYRYILCNSYLYSCSAALNLHMRGIRYTPEWLPS